MYAFILLSKSLQKLGHACRKNRWQKNLSLGFLKPDANLPLPNRSTALSYGRDF